MNRRGSTVVVSVVVLHIALLAAYTFPGQVVPERVRVIGQAYTRPLFHQQWRLFAPDPPLCSCEVQVLVGAEGPRPLYASDANYLTRRMARTIAWHVQEELSAGAEVLSVPLQQAMRAMVRDIGREVPDLSFQLVQHCVTDPSHPEAREIRVTPLRTPQP